MLHVPVLLEESLDFLLNDLSGSYLDLTFGRGSHSQEILNRLSPSGKLFAVDRDLEAVSYGKDNIADKRFEIFHANYSQIDVLFSEQQFNGILLDLGTCSTHLDNHSRGFSFQGEGPLDMRMDTSQGFSAASFLNESTEQEISDVIYKYGEEKASRRIAKAIVEFRNHTLIHSTSDLVKIIERCFEKDRQKTSSNQNFSSN